MQRERTQHNEHAGFTARYRVEFLAKLLPYGSAIANIVLYYNSDYRIVESSPGTTNRQITVYDSIGCCVDIGDRAWVTPCGDSGRFELLSKCDDNKVWQGYLDADQTMSGVSSPHGGAAVVLQFGSQSSQVAGFELSGASAYTLTVSCAGEWLVGYSGTVDCIGTTEKGWIKMQKWNGAEWADVSCSQQFLDPGSDGRQPFSRTFYVSISSLPGLFRLYASGDGANTLRFAGASVIGATSVHAANWTWLKVSC